MRGKPVSTPRNAVEWPNGFVSNMPDWITARECANANEMLFALKEARKILLLCDKEEIIASHAYSQAEQKAIYRTVDRAIDKATGMDCFDEIASKPSLSQVILRQPGMPLPPPMPLPPKLK